MNKEEIVNNIKQYLISCIPSSSKDVEITIERNQLFSPFPELNAITDYIRKPNLFDEYISRTKETLKNFEKMCQTTTTKVFKVDTMLIMKNLSFLDKQISAVLTTIKVKVTFDKTHLKSFLKVVDFYYKDITRDKCLEIIDLINKLLVKLQKFISFNNIYELDYSAKDFNDLVKLPADKEEKITKAIEYGLNILNKKYTIGLFDNGQAQYEEMDAAISALLYVLISVINPSYKYHFLNEDKSNLDIDSYLNEFLANHFKSLLNLVNSNNFLSTQSESFLKKCFEKFPNISPRLGFDTNKRTVNIGELKLNSLVGLKKVKDSIEKIKAYAKNNQDKDISIHMAFCGNPGTGKTEVARIIAQILYENKVLKSPNVVEVDREGLVGQYVGETAIKTKKAILSAVGGVLFIDEAYSLAVDDFSGDYGHEAISTLIKAMDDYRGQLCVILAGYSNEMEKMLSSNPGFKSRIQFKLNFDNFSRDELFDIGHSFILDKGYDYENDAMYRMLDITDVMRKKPDFANARTMRNIVEGSIMCQNIRVSDPHDKIITKEDVDKYIDDNDFVIPSNTNKQGESEALSGIEQLDKLIGLENVKKSVRKIKAYAIKNSNLSSFNMHMCFTGNPGTGKTEVARIMSQILYEAGALKEAKVVETDASGLISKYVGNTQQKTKELIDKAMGGVLFIDEAYALLDGTSASVGKDAISTLLKEMEDRRGRICIILAGYKNEMADLLNSNPGFDSRIQFKIDFPDYSRDELKDIAVLMINKLDYIINESALNRIIDLVMYLKGQENFANARTVRNIIDQIVLNQNLRTEEDDDNKTIEVIDVDEYIHENNIVLSNSSSDNVALSEIDLNSFKQSQEQFDSNMIDQDYLNQAIVSLSDDSGHQGTAVLISNNGLALTCAHCVESPDNFKARLCINIPGQGALPIYVPVKILKVDSFNDIALIKLENDNFKYRYISLENESFEYKPLSEFITGGYPFGGEVYKSLSLSKGNIVSVNYIENRIVVFADMFGKPGSSGSPIINVSTRKIIGIYWGGIKHGEDMVPCFTPLKPIFALLK